METKEVNADVSSNNPHNIPTKGAYLSTREEKLLINYNKLKMKYEQKVKENKFLKQNLDNTINAIKTFEESYKSIQQIYNQCKDWIGNFKMPSTNQIDFSTSDLSNVNQKASVKAPELAVMTNNPNPMIIKKMEEFESHYNEMCRGFSNMVTKYKMLKEEKNKMEDSSLKLLSRYSQLEKQYEETIRELYSKYDEIKRFKEVDKCLVDYTLNSFMLRVDPREFSQRNGLGPHNSSQLDSPGIKCEPLPTFAKFLANKK
jgi:chromosome segregation ATPase